MKRKRLEGTVFCMLLFACLCSGAGEEKKPENYTFREQSLYVPYDKLWQIFEKEGRGVFLPYEKFMELWKTAESKIPRPPQIEPPVPNLVTEMSAEALVSKDVVTVTSDVTIELLKKGWHEIGLGLADAAITSASIGDTAARLTRADNGEYKLLVEKTGDAPETVKLRIQFARAFTKSPGRNSVNFKPPPAPVSRWVIRIPEPDVKVDVQPFLAATEVPDSAAPGETRVLAFIGVTPTMSIEWTPKAEGAKGLQALANATVEQQIVIEEGLTHTKAKLSYDITRTEISQLELEVPLEERIINVYDPNVREWTVRQGATQLITVQLFQPAKGTQNLLIELERVSPPNPLVLPFVNAVNVARQQGIIVIRVAPGLRAEAIGREGLIQMDIGDLPQPLREQRWNFAYRYAAIPYNLRLNVEKLEPRILTDSLLAVHLRPEEMTVRLVTVFDVQKAGVFQLQLDLPEEFEPRNVKGVGASGIEPAEVDRFFVDKTAGNRLLINLARKAQGKIGIALEFVRTLNEPDLLSPSGKSVLLNVPIPKTRGTTFVEREQGRVLVYAPESLLINPLTRSGLRNITQAEALENMPPPKVEPDERAGLSFAYGEEPVTLALAVQRRAPHVTARQFVVANLEAGVVKYEASFFYDVLYSGVKFLRLDVPASLASEIRIITPGIRYSVFQEATNDVASGYLPWRIEGEKEFFGTIQLQLRWESKLEKLDVGKSVLIGVPRLMPAKVDRAWGQIVLIKAEAIDVVPGEDLVGLTPIDPRQELMPGVTVRDAARAFEFHDSTWQLPLRITRYEPKDVKTTSIERGLVRMVLTRSGTTSVQALYRIRSVRQRLAIRLPGEVTFESQPLRINGRPVALEQGQSGEYFIPLAGQQSDEAFLVDLRYVVAGSGSTLHVPEFLNEPAVQQVYLSVFLPAERVFLGTKGAWNHELTWLVRGFNASPHGNRNSDDLIAWISADVGVDEGALGGFPTDGQHLLFSTLRPAGGREGALRILWMPRWLFQTMSLAGIILVGLILLPAGSRPRAVAVGTILVLLALLGIFAPSFVRAAVNNATVAAVFIVFVVWVLWFFLVTLPRSSFWQERKLAREERRRARAQAQTQKSPPPVPQPGTPNQASAEGGAGHA